MPITSKTGLTANAQKDKKHEGIHECAHFGGAAAVCTHKAKMMQNRGHLIDLISSSPSVILLTHHALQIFLSSS